MAKISYIGFEGHSLQSVTLGRIRLRCPDCGQDGHEAVAIYLSDRKKRQSKTCSRCKCPVFPVTQAHLPLWEACEAVFFEHGEAVARLRVIGQQSEHHDAEAFQALRRALSVYDPVMGRRAGFVDDDGFERAKAEATAARPPKPSETSEAGDNAATLADARKHYQARKAAATTSTDDIDAALELMRDAWAIDVAAFVMMAELRALLRMDPKPTAAIADVGQRLALFRRVRTGAEKLDEGQTLLEFASDGAALIGRGVSDAVNKRVNEYISDGSFIQM